MHKDLQQLAHQLIIKINYSSYRSSLSLSSLTITIIILEINPKKTEQEYSNAVVIMTMQNASNDISTILFIIVVMKCIVTISIYVPSPSK